MTARERMLKAIALEKPDVLPVTTHHVLPCFLERSEGGISKREFFERYGLDEIEWIAVQKPDEARGEACDPKQGELGFLELPVIISDEWRVSREELPGKYQTVRCRVSTPKKELSMVLQSNAYTTWITEPIIKEKEDIDVLERYLPMPLMDVQASLDARERIGDRGIVRTHIPGAVDFYGQPGCWQDACTMYGPQKLILQTFDDPGWVHALLRMIQRRKKNYIASMKGAACDLVELGGGDGCTSVISPAIFDEFVAPYDKELIDAAHKSGQRIVYHLCGSKMALLESLAHMGMDALETLTPPAMGGDCRLREVKESLGDKMCLIGGFDQNYFFTEASEEETRAAVRKCFAEAGEGGGYILAPSDHFFEAKSGLLAAFAQEAHSMAYT